MQDEFADTTAPKSLAKKIPNVSADGEDVGFGMEQENWKEAIPDALFHSSLSSEVGCTAKFTSTLSPRSC